MTRVIGWMVMVGLVSVAMPALAQPLPPPSRFVPQLDLKCYKIDDSIPSLDIRFRLTHLNPVLVGMGLPPEDVIVRQPQQLCVPVAKDDQIPDPAVLPFIQFVDLACYGIEAATPPSVPLTLRHINPLLGNRPPEQVRLLGTNQLAVPVAKDGKLPVP